MRIGEWTTSQTITSTAQIDAALALQSRHGGLLGEILLACNALNPKQWLAAMQAQGKNTLPPDTIWDAGKEFINAADHEHYIRYRYIPLSIEGRCVIATPHDTPALRAWINNTVSHPHSIALITERDYVQWLMRHLGRSMTHNASESLHDKTPEFSAKQPITKSQQRGLAIMALALITSCILAPTATWYVAVIASTLFYLATLAFKLILLMAAPAAERRHALWERTATQLDETTLPTYSILVPLYHETPAILSQILAAIDALDYPKHKLDVWLLTEADDTATTEHLKAIAPPDYCRILCVPASLPRTKPKACNIALPLVRGEFVTIYDAEDVPAPNQLKLSVAAFSHARKHVACMQASLNYYNRDENTLTRLFSIEYSALFRLFLPALRRLRVPIPLGGTSNHIRTEALRAVGGWDPYNVTEDADLGIRLAYHGYTTDILPSLTLEESPIHLNPWLKQRSRWIKGYIQTWLVYMRSPIELLRQIGIPAFFGFQLFVGAPALTFFLAPVFWALSIIMITGHAPALMLPSWLMACCLITLVLGVALQWATAYIAITREGWKGMKSAEALYPLYWVLHSIACCKALWQLAIKPHYWEKTAHGQSRRFKKLQSIG